MDLALVFIIIKQGQHFPLTCLYAKIVDIFVLTAEFRW